MNNKVLHMITFLLLIVGGINWLLVGALDFDLVTTILGTGVAADVVYILVGLAALVELITHKKRCSMCM